MMEDKLIDIACLRPARVSELAAGGFFMPVAETGDHFLAGKAGDGTTLAVILGGERPYDFALPEEWSRAPGLTVDIFRFEVAMESAVLVRHNNLAAGDLILDDGVGIYCGRIPVWITGDPHQPSGEAVAFRKWQIVTGQDAEKVTLFTKDD